MKVYTNFSLQCLQRSSEPDASNCFVVRCQRSTPSIDERVRWLVGRMSSWHTHGPSFLGDRLYFTLPVSDDEVSG